MRTIVYTTIALTHWMHAEGSNKKRRLIVTSRTYI
jgi:hypothetical protein